MKLLSIGNSFSVDAQRWLHTLAVENGIDLQTGNLYIGGCSLETHWKNIEANAADYVYYVNGEGEGRPMSIAEALALDTWDVVTLQQASHFSGEWQTYEPYLTDIANVVRTAQPQARLYFHQTWAYEVDSTHEGFVTYHNDQDEMFRRILDASAMAVKNIDAQVLPVGTVVQALREQLPEFDYPNGGVSLNRDGFHLSLDYGRFAAAATWLYTLFRRPIAVDGMAQHGFDTALLEKIVVIVKSIVNSR
ncbi:MAG: DUF4886 domain-containing protein [Clostridia bacterium]|nr:DUF4886 domain-containing protein [Clostridia bacterium]